jgi:hypothetical protein
LIQIQYIQLLLVLGERVVLAQLVMVLILYLVDMQLHRLAVVLVVVDSNHLPMAQMVALVVVRLVRLVLVELVALQHLGKAMLAAMYLVAQLLQTQKVALAVVVLVLSGVVQLQHKQAQMAVLD